ncbi:MAG: M14 family zinc carboxypeptidase [Sphingobacterium sp.]
MRPLSFLILSVLLLTGGCDNPWSSTESNAVSQGYRLDTTEFNALHTTYKEPSLLNRRFKHSDIDSLVKVHQEIGVLAVAQIGQSVQGRSIYELEFGQGDKKVMLWSQMHGDEPTATMALFDLFNFLEGDDPEFDSVRNLLQENLNIHFIPMLNPDGAERFLRRNAQSIDLNRDARATQTVEGALLKSRAMEVKPAYGFNLHDQNIYYNVPGTKNPVTISLLAPAFNPEREINVVREGAMQIIGGMNRILQSYIPDGVAKYDDTYTPRGFGDNFQTWGASTVLIESGGLKGDPEKQQIRRLNFVIILNALMEIAQNSYTQYDRSDYEEIPFNSGGVLHDVVIHGLEFGSDSIPLKSDVAIRRGEYTVGRDYYIRGRIEDIGDLPESHGYDDLNGDGLHFVQGNIAPQTIPSLQTFSQQDAYDLLKQGYMGVQVADDGQQGVLHDLPIHVFASSNFATTPFIDLGGTANFYLASQNGDLKYAVLNGYLLDLSKGVEELVALKNRVH